MRVKPARPGVIIRDPHTRRPLASEGADVPETSYWLRRLRDGDVERLLDEDRTPRPEMDPVAPLATRDEGGGGGKGGGQ